MTDPNIRMAGELFSTQAGRYSKGAVMKKTGFLFDQRFLLHDTGPYHPECSERLSAIYQGIRDAGLMSHVSVMPAVLTDMKWVLGIHTQEYVRRFEELCLAGRRTLDSEDNQMSRDTWEAAQLAVGGVLEAARGIMAGDFDNAFCAIRPPGHHAESGEAMGFCYFNNVAIAARYLQ
jgi:acetoin utilization deacetylase AcuC-like enzyme